MIDADLAKTLSKLTNLASPRLGTTVHSASDEFFGAKERLILDAESVFFPGKYDANGKWVDGWETKRRRGLGNDWCLVRLGVAGTINYLDVDTRHFTGNFPPGASVQGCDDEDVPTDRSDWRMLLPAAQLGPNARHVFPVADARPIRWLRLSIFPDGGVARLRAYGRPFFERRPLSNADAAIELSAVRNGGRIIGVSDAHYGDPWVILTEGKAQNMGDGWETRPRREPGNDWMVIALGVAGVVTGIEVDTAHFKGNFPEKVSLQGCKVVPAADDVIVNQSMFWPELMAAQPAQADHVHTFGSELLADLGPISHVKLNLHPDGGLARFRVFGRPAA